MNQVILFLIIALPVAIVPAATFIQQPSLTESNGQAVISFSVSGPTDVEAAVLDNSGRVVRHLAAGVLNGDTLPPEPLVSGLTQNLSWTDSMTMEMLFSADPSGCASGLASRRDSKNGFTSRTPPWFPLRLSRLGAPRGRTAGIGGRTRPWTRARSCPSPIPCSFQARTAIRQRDSPCGTAALPRLTCACQRKRTTSFFSRTPLAEDRPGCSG